MARTVYWLYLGIRIAVFHYFCRCNQQFWHTRSAKDYALTDPSDVVLPEASGQGCAPVRVFAAWRLAAESHSNPSVGQIDLLRSRGVLHVRHRWLRRI